jgi:membrane glycosyltransferase
LFLVPEEASGSPEIRQTAALARSAPQGIDFVAAIVDPIANARARAMAPHGHGGGEPRASAEALLQHALVQGPQVLSMRDKMTLLEDARLLEALHRLVTSSETTSPGWRLAGTQPDAPAVVPKRELAGQPLAGAV